MKFCVTGLPRSRTAWFSVLFNALGERCLHDGINGCHTKEQAMDRLHGIGNADTAIWAVPVNEWFDCPVVVIHRAAEEVERSIVGLFGEHPSMKRFIEYGEHRLAGISGLHVAFDEIDARAGEIVRYCTGKEADDSTLSLMKRMHVSTKRLDGDPKTIGIDGVIRYMNGG